MSKEENVKCPHCESTVPVVQATLLYVRIDNRGKPIEERLHGDYCLSCRDRLVKKGYYRQVTVDYWFFKAESKEGKVVYYDSDGKSHETDLKPGNCRNL